ncbi:hypothetical protein AB833_25630 [Chromatiales bacterium (ex Bugula neritina AB1)]|nr:hypothetical protein AB833_25630 [Chromatiales bacterium (ex Bugula neritina AB1)]
MLYLRSLLFWIVFALSIGVYWLPVLLSVVLPLRKRYDIVNLWVRFIIWWLKVTCKMDYEVKGGEHAALEPAIIFAKHQSTWETFALKLFFPHSVYVAKRELLWIPCFGWAFAALDYIYINRSAGRRVMAQLIDQARKKVANGFSITIFPEGTRTALGAAPAYKKGGAVIAVKTGTPVLPVAHNAGEFWPRHSFLKWPGTITISIGPPIKTAGRDAEEVLQEASAWIEKEMESLYVPDRFPY